jgi:hypothetical protein
MDHRSMPNQLSIADLAGGRLRRAIVGLPKWLAEPDEPIQERIVFFESPLANGAGKYLQDLLGQVWCLDTADWLEQGYIYNVHSAADLLRDSFSPAAPGDLYLFETGCGGDSMHAVGPNRVHYARANTVDLFVRPRVARRLGDVIDTIEMMYAEDARQRAGKLNK